MSLRVLLMDDSTTMLGRLLDGLKDVKGVEIVGKYDNGQTALEAIRLLKPDLALLDNMVPHLTGTQVIDAIRAENLPTKALLVTSVGQRCVLENYTTLIKPFNRVQMSQKIYDLFGKTDFTEGV
jgi:DNA-binding NarL/FixJ family response regulator